MDRINRLGLSFELLDEVVISRRAASSGGQLGLDYLPGAHLLGALAAALYRELSREDAWLLFHTGKVRFGNALPLAGDGQPAWPLPLCWRRAAEQPPVDAHGVLVAERVLNLLHADADTEPTGPLPTLPEGYIALSGRFCQPRVAFRMKSTLAPDTGRLSETSAFGYESLTAGQRFHADIAYDADIPAYLAARLEDFFAARPILSFGRSRSAQYGRVACEPGPVATPPPCLPPAGRELSLWLLSDLAACDPHGFPTLAPEAVDLGLPPADPIAHKTFIHPRSYSPYNSFHGLHGAERQVIAQGSVLSYHLRDPLDSAAWAALTDRLAHGLGLYREFGLGRCLASPALLAARHPGFAAAPAPEARPVPAPVPPPDHPLARWLLQAAEHGSLRGGMKQWAAQAVWELEQLERNARRLNGLREDQTASPSRAHWGRVAEAARRAAAMGDGPHRLHAELFADANSICRRHDEEWNRPTANPDGQALTYRDWLEQKMAERPADAPSALGLLAELAQRRLSGKR